MPDRLEFVFTDIADIKWSVCSLKWVTCSNDQSCHFGCHQNAIKFEFQSTASILYYDTSSGKKTITCRYNSKKTKLSAVSFFGKRKRKCCIWYFLLQSNFPIDTRWKKTTNVWTMQTRLEVWEYVFSLHIVSVWHKAM